MPPIAYPRILRALMAICVGLAVPAIAATSDPPAPWEQLRKSDLRVATAMYRLATANRRYCRNALGPQPGFALHSIAQYPVGMQQAAARNFGLGFHVGIMAVVENSPAARAGLRADDQLISVNGRDLRLSSSGNGMPTNAPVEAARLLLLAELEEGPITILVARTDGNHAVRFRAEEGCRSSVEFDPGNQVNASADGERVTIGGGLLDRCVTDGDLAFVIAHELAHNLLHHAKRLARGGVSGAGRLHGIRPGTAEMQGMEKEADRLAVQLATNAGYDLNGTASFLSDLQSRKGMDRLPATHPAPALRLALLRAAIAAVHAEVPDAPARRSIAWTKRSVDRLPAPGAGRSS